MDPPSLDAGSVKQWLWFGFGGVDYTSSGDAVPTGPAGWTSFGAKSAASTSSVGLAGGYLNSATQTLDPPACTNSAPRVWLAFTLAIPPP